MAEPRGQGLVSGLVEELLALLRTTLAFLQAALFGWLITLLRRLRWLKAERRRLRTMGWNERGRSILNCMPMDEKVYRRPDPLIYAQYYLMAQGLAVTWDNPDIQLFKGGVPVSSEALEPDTDYQVTATVWNGSTEAPAVHLPVRFTFANWGIGTPFQMIGIDSINLPVKGAPGHPARAEAVWHTPAEAGHYCLRVELLWDDDANPHNNLGQENTNVVHTSSPTARFTLTVRNEIRRARTFRLDADAYRLPSPQPCDPTRRATTPEMSEAEVEAKKREARARHGRQLASPPPSWRVLMTPNEVRLGPEEEETVAVEVTPHEDFAGRQTININAFDGPTLVGGVTVQVEG